MYAKRLLRQSALYVVIAGIFFSLIFMIPFQAHAFLKPLGGRIITITPCFGAGIHVVVGPPTVGSYIWFPFTRTYLFGPPRNPGQWLLGNSAPISFVFPLPIRLVPFPGF